jgi:NAD(P)-dependent dehydrogenase (short-subunit alcohol dehydrogenase family)
MSAKALLVTGASRGIGRACALLAGRNGWAVGVNYREDTKAADAVVEAIAKGGGRSVALKGDIAVEADVLGMFDAATKVLGPLTAVIANAGIIAPTAKLAEMSIERMRRVFEVNVLGAYLTAGEATRRMSKSLGGAGGSIVMMSSAAARLGSPNLYVDYAGSKGAIDTLTLGLAKELGAEGVRSTPSALGSSTPIFTPAEARRTAHGFWAPLPQWGAQARPRKSPRRPSG